MVQNIELSKPVNFQWRLPVKALEVLRAQSRERLIPINQLGRSYMLAGLEAAGFCSSDDWTNGTEIGQDVQGAESNDGL